jgi:small subunit ribosomal protein S1
MTTERNQDEETNDESFEELLEHSMNRRDDFAIGSRVEGTVVFITAESVFVDILGKSEAVIDLSEFKNEDGTVSINVGDPVQAYVVSLSGGEIHLTTSIGKGATSPAILEMAYHESIPVSGTILGPVKGGYSISVGGIKCFCPVSQLEYRPSGEQDSLQGKSFNFKVIEYKEKGKNVILSRSVLLGERRKQAEESLRTSLKEGNTVTGTIAGIRDFGVFVDLGGIEALVPKSELSWGRFSDTGVFIEGEKTSAVVKSIDWDRKRITLSIKDLLPDPWGHIEKYKPGQTISGRVVNIIKTGAFIEIEPGIDGFIPLSRMSYLKQINRPEEAVSVGSQVTARIVTIRPGEKKISLDLVTEGPDPWEETGELSGSQRVTVESVKQSGLHVRLSNGMLGFIPKGELLVKNESEIQKRYAAGTQIQAAVLEINQDNRKLILSESQALKMEEKKDYESFIKKESSTRSSTLGAMFKDAFADIQKKMDK